MTTTTRDEALQRIISLSRWAGETERDLVILAEGNTSVRTGAHMLIKASGAAMAGAEAADFVEVDREPLTALIESGSASDAEVSAVLRAATVWGSKMPSVETLLHVVCQEYDTVHAVLHTHPTPVNALLCSSSAEAFANAAYFPDQIVSLGRKPLLVPYIDPGLVLAHEARILLRQHVDTTGEVPKVIYLRNHGMFALGATVLEAQQITQMAVKSARIVLGALAAGGASAMADEHTERIHSRPDENFRRLLLAAGVSDS